MRFLALILPLAACGTLTESTQADYELNNAAAGNGSDRSADQANQADQSDQSDQTQQSYDDYDNDGVDESEDCDDSDPRIGALLYHNTFKELDGYLHNTSTLTDPWYLDGGSVFNSEGGQQALIGDDESWTNTVTFATLSGDGAAAHCGGPDCYDTDRFRSGVLARMSADDTQDEGFYGYRCAVAQNAEDDCYTPGKFLQISAFLDAPEDDLYFECEEDCVVNTTFDQLARVNHDTTDFLAGDAVTLTFWAVDNTLVCEMVDEHGNELRARATDDRFAAGGTGLSVLNGYSQYDEITVCEALNLPMQ